MKRKRYSGAISETKEGEIDKTEVDVSLKLQNLINQCISSKNRSEVDSDLKPRDNSNKDSPEQSENEHNTQIQDRASKHIELEKDSVRHKDDSKIIFIGNIPLSIETKSDLIKALGIDSKIIKSVHFRSLPIDPKFASNKKIGVIKKRFTDAKNSKNAYVTLTDEKYTDDLLKKNTCEIEGHHLFINDTSPTSFSKFSRKKSIFVGRLPPSTNEDELFDLFSNISPVKAVRIVRDPKTLKSKGFGFVAFDTRSAVPEAINAFNNTKFKGYTLNVMKSLDEISSRNIKLKSRNTKKKANKFRTKTRT